MRSAAALFLALLVPLPAARGADGPLSFRHDVMAWLSKSGCNAGACHGNANGKGGFKLSLRGQDPDLDWIALSREQAGRRIDPLDPANSLILLKATAAVAHQGGQRFTADSEAHAVLARWIAAGAADDGTNAAALARLEVTPREQILDAPRRETRLRATAVFADGTRRDVTDLAVYEPSNLLVAVAPDGEVTSQRPGETTVLVRYLDRQEPVRLAFVPARPGWRWRPVPTNNLVDTHVFAKLRSLALTPAAPAPDEVFLRRAHLDLLGMIPTAAEARAFAADPAPDRRVRLVNDLLERPEFADFWALKWADLLRLEERQLDTNGMRVFHTWIRDSLAANRPLDEFARGLIAGKGSTYTNAPANWYRANRNAVARSENTAQLFLGTRMNCAQCHNHPFDRWTQDDYHDWTAVFARVEYQILENKRTDENDKLEFKGDQVVFLTNGVTWTNPRTGRPATPRFLGEAAPPATDDAHDELDALADWVTRPDNPWFARMQANRIWYHLMGRGLVDPVDDFRASNPASHPALLDALADELASSGFDLRRVVRLVMNSRTYQLASEPAPGAEDDELNYAWVRPRRLGAEQLLDSQARAAGATLKFKGQADAVRAAQLIEGRRHYKPLRGPEEKFMASFGKPPRLVCSESERSNETTLPQALQLLSGPLLHDLLTQSGNRLGTLLAADTSPAAMVDGLFWAALSRPPTPGELGLFTARLEADADRRAGLEDLLWALVNAKEFVFRN
ncbi:MAG: DUF1549 and DUF1553 domain-containing protein [Limisphaerales bacterium]